MPDDIPSIARKDLLSTGSTLLNLANTGSPYGGFMKGRYFFLVGDSASGKTFLSMTCFAEAAINPDFAGYRFIYDNVEDGMLLDLDTLFNEATADRIEPPETGKDGEPAYSETIEEFYYHLDDAVAAGKPFIYVLDSMDGLDSEAAEKKFLQHKKAHQRVRGAGEPAEKVAGSYGDGKAKRNSEGLRKALRGLRETGSILIIISQTRDDIGSMFPGAKTRAGGRALRFYATNEIWSKVVKTHTKDVLGKKRRLGVRVGLEVKKNRVNGRLGYVEVDIYPDYGIDDLGSVVDYLVDEGYWPAEKQTITCRGLPGVSGTREKVIKIIERQGLEDAARALAGKCWAEVQAACALRRKARYANSPESS